VTRTPLKRRAPLRAGAARLRRRPRANPVSVAEQAAREAWKLDLGACVVCPAEGGACRGSVQGHHAIGKQTLKRLGLRRLLWDRRNRVPVCEHRHEQHTSGYRPIPRELLPASVFEFAEEVGLGWWLDRHYPARRAAA